MVTIADVARHAGVSASTVGYVLRGKRLISHDTRRRVERSMAELGYHPPAGDGAPAARRSHVLALMMPPHTDMYAPTMTDIAGAVTVTARQYGYDVLLMTHDEHTDGACGLAAGELADGVILMDSTLDDERIPAPGALGARTVLIGVPDDSRGLACVDHDFTAAGALCADHLAELGHRDVAVIGHAARTLAGFRERARRHGMRFLHRPCEGTYESTAGVLGRVLADRPGTTAFFVQNEDAIGPLLHLLRTGGRTVPDDASVVVLGQGRLAEQHTPRLTTVTGPADALGRAAVEQLVRRITATVDGEVPGDELLLLPPVLTVRESSGPAPAVTPAPGPIPARAHGERRR